VKVDRVTVALDTHYMVNPLTIAEQAEGGVIFGLSGALYGKITVKDGVPVQGNFDTYRMVRLAEAPRIDVHLVPSGGKVWGGAGEPAILLEERHHGHDLPGLAVATLRHVLGKPSLLHRMFAVGRKPFDGGDAGAIQRSDWYRARTHSLSSDVDGARTALRDAASEFRSGQADRIA
jgi:hypothetical protein